MGRVWGYARVSTTEQHLDRQLQAIKEYYPKIRDVDIFKDKETGRKFERDEYQIMKRVLRSGDTLIIKEVDRLGRNKELIKEELRWMKDNGIRLKILSIPTTLIDLEENDWVMDMVGSILIEVYTSLAEQDYLEKRERQREGIEIAKAKGVYTGRKPVELNKRKFESIYSRWKKEEIQGVEASKLLGVSRPTFYKKVQEYETGKAGKWLK